MAQLKIFNLPSILTQSSLPSLSLPGYIQSFRASSSPHANKVGDALEILQQYADTINTIIGAIISQLQSATVNTGGGGLSATVVDQVLSAGTVVINPALPSSPGQFLLYFIQGGGPTALFTWGSNVRFVTTNWDSSSGFWNVFTFVSRVDPVDSIIRWFETCIPYVGQF